MSYLDYQDITSNLSFLKAFDFIEIRQTLNNHSELFVRGLVDEEDKDSCVKKAGSQDKIEICGKDGKKLFVGIIQSIKVRAVNQVYYVEIKGISYSFLMDVEKIKKSYQDKNLTYEDILTEKMAPYFKGSMINTVGSGKKINELIVQYQETDWNFIKRLASHFNQPIVPSVRQEGVKLFFGIPEGKTVGEFTNFNYEVERDISRYLVSSANHNKELGEADTMEYTITTEADFDIGDSCTFQQTSLYIKEKQVRYEEGLLTFIYKLAPKKGLSQAGMFCDTIQGASLRGTVLEAIKDKVKVHLEIDDKQDVGKAWEFPYTTLYTAKGNTGWYCMPEIGDTVQIYFPENVEALAVGLNSLRTEESKSDKIDDPEVKYFRTADGKELKFSKEEILITCMNGKDEAVYIRLNQDKGIEIISTDSIKVKSDKNIVMNAEESIKVLAGDKITFKCKSSEIKVDGKVTIAGQTVKIN